MDQTRVRRLVVLLVTGIIIYAGSAGCALKAIDAGHEGVFVEKPFFIGHGGVDPTPVKPGRSIVALTTELIQVDLRPNQFSEHFDIISAENAPVSFDAFLIANVLPGKSPELISRFGPNWYRNNVKEAFRTFVREEVQQYQLFQLTTDPATRPKLQKAIAERVQHDVIDKIGLPVNLNRVVIGGIMPPEGVLKQTAETIVQEQRRLTMVQFERAEEAREKAERQRGLADLAFREALGLTAPEFIELRRVEVQKEIVTHAPEALTIIMGMERFGVNLAADEPQVGLRRGVAGTASKT
jgi:regulator of protease activity HflC (stomatin/prohibitin superfamily)